ncbi:MAG: hemerythrin [Anaerolineae bacterium]
MTYPSELHPIFEHFITCEYASLTKAGGPITMPVTPYPGANGTVDVSTGLVYPAKAERARRDRRVGLLFSHPTGSGLSDPPTVLVIGDASVRDRDLQANTDRYIRESSLKLPDMMSGFPPFLVKRQGWYWVRIWIEVTPLKVFWWPDGDSEQPPQRWEAPAGTSAPPSDPPPQGSPLNAWKEAPHEWRSSAAYAVQVLGRPTLTVIGEEGYPYPLPVRTVRPLPEGFTLELPHGLPLASIAAGSACLTFHRHPEKFTGQENMLFVGHIEPTAAHSIIFHVDRRVVDWSGGGSGVLSKLFGALSFLNAGFHLTPRLRHEAERRGQPVPAIRIEKEK